MNDWIPWKGGECPVPEDTLVEVKIRHRFSKSVKVSAEQVDWTHAPEDPNADIIEYRISK